MTRRQEWVTFFILMSFIVWACVQFVKAHDAMAQAVAMARFEREFLPDLAKVNDLHAEAKKIYRESYSFDLEGSHG